MLSMSAKRQYRFVCVTSKQTSETVCLTSYKLPHGGSDLFNSVKIWEACCATLMTSSFFNSITLRQYQKEFIDGVLSANNLIWELWDQAQLIWNLKSLNNKIKCLIFIKTGVSSLNSFWDDVFHIEETLIAIVTKTEQTAERFCRNKSNLSDSGCYYQFNVICGLEGIGLEELKKKNEIAAATRCYVGSQAVFKQMRACADHLLSREH